MRNDSAAAAAKLAADIRIRDPFILPDADAGVYTLYGTTALDLKEGEAPSFVCYQCRDLVSWRGPLPAFSPPADFWANTQFWAPECHLWQGRYYLFASFARDGRQRGTQILVADRPEGPFVPHSDGVVTPREWECLDGTLYVDEDGVPWMVFCHEWVQVEDGEMCAVRLREDLREAVGEPELVFRASEAPWSKPFDFDGRQNNRVTDGPYLFHTRTGTLLMLWSTIGHDGYAMGIATSVSGTILGPWRQSTEPLFGKDGGHGMLFSTFDKRLMLTLHVPNQGPDERLHLFQVEDLGETIRIVS